MNVAAEIAAERGGATRTQVGTTTWESYVISNLAASVCRSGGDLSRAHKSRGQAHRATREHMARNKGEQRPTTLIAATDHKHPCRQELSAGPTLARMHMPRDPEPGDIREASTRVLHTSQRQKNCDERAKSEPAPFVRTLRLPLRKDLRVNLGANKSDGKREQWLE